MNEWVNTLQQIPLLWTQNNPGLNVSYLKPFSIHDFLKFPVFKGKSHIDDT